MWMQQYKTIRILQKILGVCAIILTAFLILVMLIGALDYLELWSDTSVFSGASFLSPSWLLLPALLLALILYLVQKKTLSSILVIVYTVYFLLMGDISFASLFSNEKAASNDKQLSVLTLNVRYYSYGMDNIFNFLDSLDADVVLLSENTLPADSIQLLSNLDDKYTVFTGKKYETAVLSKFPVVFAKEVEFPTYQASLSGSNEIDSLDKNPHRSFSHLRVIVEDKEIDVISVRFIAGRPKTHKLKDQLEWGRYLIEQQKKEVDFFVDYVEALDRPVIFGGDLNVPPNAKVMKPLYDIAKDVAREEKFIPSPTFRTEFPVMRLDYLFTMNGIKTLTYSKLDAVVSDHFPVYAKFAFNY